jgi:transcriptional regulator with XRE-family HTH domain
VGVINLEIFERIKALRKDFLDLTQEEFSKRIMISRANLGSIEVGRINVTDRVIIDICREFDISENWLRTGDGEMFSTLPPEDEYIRAAAEISKDPGEDLIRQVIIEYWKLNPEGKKYFKDFIINISKHAKKEE